MLRFVLSRLLLVIPTFLGIILLTFILIHMVPGDPILLLLGRQGAGSGATRRNADPIGGWIGHFTSSSSTMYGAFCTATSARRSSPAAGAERVPDPVPGDAGAVVCAMVFAVVIGLPAGVVAAERRGSVFDHALMGGRWLVIRCRSLVGTALILLFSVQLYWTPVSGRPWSIISSTKARISC